MALDHVRDFFHFDAFVNDPLDVTTTTVPLYFTRWITHFCAPVFVFLAGTSVYLQGLRKDKNELSMFLFKRGLWLIFVELVIITFSWTLNLRLSCVRDASDLGYWYMHGVYGICDPTSVCRDNVPWDSYCRRPQYS